MMMTMVMMMMMTVMMIIWGMYSSAPQLWMSPMGYTKTHPKDHEDHMRVMKIATDALAEPYGTR